MSDKDGRTPTIRHDLSAPMAVLIRASDTRSFAPVLSATAAFLVYGFLWVAFYFASVTLGKYYTGGDQLHYHNLWYSLIGARFGDIIFLQLATTGAVEPLYGLIAWIGTHLMDKSEWMSIFNATFCCLLVAYLRSVGAYFVVYPLIFSNFYLLVLLFAAERLKFACLVLFGCLFVAGPVRYLLLASAPLFHFQSVILLSGYLAAPLRNFVSGFVRGKLHAKSLLVLLSALALFVTLYFIFNRTILAKFGYYVEADLSETFKSLVFLFVAMLVAKDKLLVLMMFVPVVLAAYLLGDERVNMVTFFFMMYFLMPIFGGLHPLTLIFLGYFSVKGFFFISDVIEYGTGFP